MKTKISRFSKSVLSVILAMTLIMSTMLIGTLSVNATISGISKIYFTPDSNWADARATFKLNYEKSDGNWDKSDFTLVSGTDNVYEVSLDSSTTYNQLQFQRYSSDGNTYWNSSKLFSSISDGMNYFTKTNTEAWSDWYPDSNNGTWSTYSGGSSTEPSESFYLEYWHNNKHNFIKYNSYSDGVYTWETKFDFGQFASDGKFRLTNSETWTDNQETTFCVPAYKMSNSKSTSSYVNVTASGVSVVTESSEFGSDAGSWGHSKYYDIKLKNVDTNKTYVVTYEPGKSNSLDGTITIADKSSITTTYTITKGTVDTAKGDFTVTVNGTSAESAEAGDTITVTTNPNTANNYVVDKVTYTPENGTEIEVTASNDTYTFKMPASNVTVNVTFKSTSTEPDEKFYLEYWDGSTHQFIPYTSYADGVFTWETKFNFGSFSSDGKFRLTNTTTWTDSSESSFCVPAYKRSNQKGTETYVTVTASGASVETDSSKIDGKGSYGVSEHNDIKLNGIDTSKTYIVTYKPGSSNSLDGQITIADKSVTPTLATPKIKGDSSALPGSTITVALDNQKDFGADEDGDGKYKSDYENLKFTYTVTASDGTTPEVTPIASGKILASDGTTAINDKISFTASAIEGVTYTITCKVSADDFADVTSSELTVKVGTIPYAQADRIYAYAKTLGADETPALNAWVASETNALKLDTHKDKGPVNPTLGKTTDTDIRIFLPTTASSSKVVLYNSFSTSITVNGTEIQSGKYAEVSYTPNTEYTISNGKKLTIYKSTADGALYVNNTGDYASIDNNGALSMINQLYSDKEKGEIAAGNAGALADSNGVQDVAVKKIKGRGNSTWVSANKKSFNVTFTDNINAFGFKQGKKFSLLANFKDPSLSRNKILYELADLMGVKYSPDAATVDLYMNGLYMGSYLMCQKVDVGSKELVNDLGKTLLEDLYTDSATGKVPESAADAIKSSGFSFLMELDSNADKGDFYITVDSQKITIKEPEYLNGDGSIPTDAVTKAAQEFVQTKYAELNTAMSNTSITLENLNKIIDVESLVKYYLINEIAKNYDIGVSSTYLVYNYTKGKFYISPLWDMDVTTGNCKYTESDYQSYEGNWTDNNSSSNYFMKKVMANPQVQSAARKLWTGSYYTILTNYIDTLTTKATSVEGSLNCNYTKWNYPYGFQGTYHDDVQALTSLNVATYNPSDNTYTVASSSTSYETTAVGQTQYVSDWLKSRVAWMSKKYNTYTLSGYSGWSEGSAVTNSSVNGVTTWKLTSSSSTNAFKISTDGYAGKDSTHSCINYDTSVKIVNDSSVATISAASGTNMNFGFTSTGTISESSPVYLIYNQKTNTLTLSDKETTSANPSVTLSGSAVASEDIKDGTAVTLTATITPATNNSVVVTGDYTATLYIGERVVTTKTVTFADNATEETTMNAVFSTYLEGTNQTYKVVVTCNDGEQDRKGTSNTVTYKQTGVKDQKIYFDPSTHTTTVDSKTVYDWLEATTKDSTVTVTIKNSSSVTPLDTFTMYIDSDDIHGLDKGVFRGDISEDTLAYFKDPSNTITFSMDDTSLTYSVSGQSDITSGWIYNYSSEKGQALWEQYNVSYEEAYPSSRTDSKYANITTFAQFKDYIKDQKALKDAGQATDNIVYFDNSVSKWYNVYIYGWEQLTGSPLTNTQATIMKKLPYADIWYYDFGTAEVKSNFLFKDRSGPGFGNNYQETVDLVDGYIKNGDGDEVQLFFETTLTNSANPIFVTQNFYNSTIKKASDGTYDETLKYRAFNTQWDEFATILSNTVQTKAVDVYFDLHDKATDVANIQLYHSSTNYTFASAFTRLTQMSGSTIFHASILLPYTDNGIAFKFDQFVVNYSDGSTKTCAMSANVQPEFTCINTGEVWYEINSDFANLGIDPKVDSASLLKANSPLLKATSKYEILGSVFGGTDDGWNKPVTLDQDYGQTNKIYAVVNLTKLGNFKIRKDNTYYYGCGSYTHNISYVGASYDNPSGLDLALTHDGTNDSYELKFTGDTGVYKACLDTSSMNIWFEKVETSFNTVTLNGTVNGDPVTDTIAMTYSNGVWSVTLDFTGGINKFKARVNNDWIISFGNGQDGESGNYSESLTGTYKISIEDGAANGTALTVENVGSTPTPTISLSATSNSLTLDNGTASTTLTSTVTNASGKTVTYSVDNTDGVTLTPSANTLSADFEVTKVGTYVVTATIEGTTATDQVTITVSKPVITDYCGVLAYNHSTATFDVTGGGTIDKTDVVLTNGYYTTGDVTTGYTSYDGTTYTVIYALPSTASSGATTSYSSTTRHTDSNYEFNDWTKNGIVKTTDKALSDEISGTSTVAYVANWSLVKKVSYTFTYKYYEFNTSEGMAYADGRATILNDGYVIQVTLPENSSDDAIKAAYLANAPKLESDYYIYTFDGVEISVNGLYASAIANNDTIRYYTVRFDNGDTTTVNNYYYQHVAELSYDGDVPEGKYVAWKNENGEILHYGTTYKFRVTRNIDIKYEFVNSDSVSPATYVNEPTYEFYINNTGKEYVRFNILVENVLANLSIDNVEFGTLYFFTDSTGKPNDSTISVEADLDPNTLITVSEDGKLNVKSGVGQHNVNTVSSEYKYIYAPKMPNTSANVDRYVRVYSYIAVKDDNGKYKNVIVSNSYALASIRDALNKS